MHDGQDLKHPLKGGWQWIERKEKEGLKEEQAVYEEGCYEVSMENKGK